MQKMMRKTLSSSSPSSYCSSRRGMPCLPSTLIVIVNNFLALFHSQSSKPTKSTITQLGKLVRDGGPPPLKPRVTNLEDALKVFDEMLQRRPLPSVVRFNQILTQVSKLKHYSAVISLNKRMSLLGIASDVYTLSIIINCYCHLKQMEFSLSVLGQFFKLGLQSDVTTFTTLINGFIIENRLAEAAGIFSKMVEGGHCEPNVVTFSTIIKGFCMSGNNSAAIQLLRKMEERSLSPTQLLIA
ncbi:hypothetical protein M0R45_014700 [Rubus argutus]|uniref:Pentatricopeptide repeat-containing protein n=1 Tax=Rubus argutus TaxID=59490 RepID=A0AAW1XM27_RUBAR